MFVYARTIKLAKWERLVLKEKNYQFKDILKIVHTDLCGPIGIESYDGKNIYSFC